MADDQFATWRALLSDPKALGASIQINENDPQPGYWRARPRKTMAWLPVVFWYGKDDGALRCLHGRDKVFDLDAMRRLWLSCVRNPISTPTYKHWLETGGWGDVDDAVADQVVRPGSNVADIPPEELIRDQIESALAGVDKYQAVDSDEQAAAAQSLRARLLELKGEADKIRVKEKRPHLEASQAVDAKWQPLVKDSQGGADRLRLAIAAYETRKAEAARLEAQQRYEAERAAAEEHALPPPEIAEPETVTGQVRGGYGKAASVRMVRVLDQVTSWVELSQFYLHRKELQDLLRKYANADLKGNAEVPGITVKEIADVR
jgi:hypothetical protein